MEPENLVTQYHAWALAVAFLNLKMFANSMVQGQARKRAQVLAAPEDEAAMGLLGVHGGGQKSDLMTRAEGCWRNDLENIPMFLILTLAYILVGANTQLLVVTLVVFCVARTLHTVAYLNKIQPLRSIVYGVGALAAGVVIVATVLSAL